MPVPPGMRRVVVDLEEAQRDALAGAKSVDGVGVTLRLRALVAVWVESPDLQVLVSARAVALADEAGARRSARGNAARWGSSPRQ